MKPKKIKSMYKKCISCGKYFLDSSENNRFCSDECKNIFARCTICGNYFQIKKEDNIDKENYICSNECSKRFRIKKKF